MGNSSFKRISGYLFVFIFFYMSLACITLAAEQSAIKKGNIFPEVLLRAPEDDNLKTYLGIGEMNNFAVKDIKAELILVEIMNINCGSCQSQAPVYNRLYSMIESDTNLKNKVKIVAVAAGNFAKYVKKFTDYFKVQYPVIEDPNWYYMMRLEEVLLPMPFI